MPTIRKIGILVIILLSFSFPLIAETASQNGPYSFSIKPLAGLIIGKSEEVLFKYDDSDQYVSQLLWDLKPLVYTGLELGFGPGDPFDKSGFTSSASLKYGFPFKTGIIEDRDWADSYYDYLTHYSRHSAYSQNAALADLSAGYSFRITNNVVLGAGGKFSFMHFSWMAENGFFQYSEKLPSGHYAEWDESLPKQKVYGAVIRYAQNWFIFTPELSVKAGLSGCFYMELNLSLSPLIFCADRDDHLLPDGLGRGTLFFGRFLSGQYLNLGTRLCYSIQKNLDLSLSLSCTNIKTQRGKTNYAKTGVGASGTSNENYDGRAGYAALDLNLALNFRFYGRR